MTTTLPAAGLFTGTSKAEAILAAVVFGAQKFMHGSDWSADLEQWLERLGVATGVAVVRVFENDPLEEGGTLCTSARAHWLATHARGSSIEGLQHVPYVESGCARWIEVLSRGEALVGNREDFPVSERAIMEREEVVSMAIVPVFAGTTWWGFLGFAEFDEKRPWLEGEMHALFAAAGILGAALHRRAMEQRIAESAARDQLTTEIGDVLTASTHRLEDVLHMCSARIAHHLAAALVCVWTVDRDQTGLCAGRAASSSGVSVQPSNVRIGEYAVGQIAQSHRAQNWNRDVPELWAGSTDVIAAAGLTAGAAHPLCIAGQVVGVVLVLHDRPLTSAVRSSLASVTDELALAIERGRATEMLHLNEERYRRLVDATLEGICIHDGIRIRDGNPAIAALVGYEVDEIIGRSPLEFMHPDYVEEVKHRIVTGYTGAYEVDMMHRDGYTIPVEIRGRNFVLDGEKLRVTTIRDLRERKEAERTAQRLVEERDARAAADRRRRHAEFLVDASRILASSFDTTTTLNQVAHQCVRFLSDFCVVSVFRGDEMEHVARVHADPSKSGLLNATLELWNQQWQFDHPFSLRQRKGEPFTVHLTDADIEAMTPAAELRALLDQLAPRSLMSVPIIGGGELIGTIMMSAGEAHGPFTAEELATTEELGRRAAVALQSARSYHDAHAATRARDEMLAVVAHDLRNPLNVIHMGSSLVLEMTEPDAPGHRQLAIIQRSAEHMNRLIQDLLDATRLQSGQLALDVAPTRVQAIIDDAADLLKPLAQHAGIELEVFVADDVPRIAADRARVLQVLSNLVGNALKFTPRDGRVRISAEPSDCGVRVTVADTGPGIPAEQLPHIFGRFWQARRTDRRGLGLGLAIARGIVEAHGGEISVESVEGAGSAFAFTLPRVE
jgi:PAS domain S-box-containing protein